MTDLLPGRARTHPLTISHIARAQLLAVVAALAAGAAVAWGQPLLAAAVVAPVVLVAAFPNTQRLGEVLVFAGFATVAAISDSVGSNPGVTEADVHFSPFKWLAYGLLVGGALCLVLPASRPSVRLRAPHLLILGYLLCSGVGAALNPEPGLFLLRWVQVSIPFLAAVALWRRRGPSTLLVTAVLLSAGWQLGAAIVSLARGQSYFSGAAAADALSVEGSRLGGLVHPVLLAFSAAVIGVWALWLILTRPPRRALVGYVALPLAGLALGFSRGRTGFLAFLAMGVVVAAVARRHKRSEQHKIDPRMFLVVGVGLAAVVLSTTIAGWFVRGNSSEVQTLTNRTRLWNAAFQLVSERPLSGWGPGLLRSGKMADEVRDKAGFVGHAHNALLDAVLAGGLIGGTFWLLGFVGTGRLLFRRRAPADDLAALLSCLWAGLAVWGVVEGNLSGFGFSWLLFLGLTVAVPAATRTDPVTRRPSNAPALV